MIRPDKSLRVRDEERVMKVFSDVGKLHPEGSEARVLATIEALTNLIDDVRHETVAQATETAVRSVGHNLTLLTNSYMSPERLRRLLRAPFEGSTELHGTGQGEGKSR
jgi:hypothetical protein